ncbi:DUF2190 domain-containing protein [Williamsia herbipolensis]|uniref:DUF2190 domain-containing protein n=1 Tax=Williamsia herbipolensis TaxID=1603258 RepID=A0AAU4JYF1_9NOCA|nr:DUF2190 domain-containing protein [Williamsia herbipolensis]
MSTVITTNVGVYAPGADVTAQAATPVVARTFVAIVADRPAGGNIQVGPAAAAGRTCGVARNDATAGGLTVLARGNSRVVRVTTSGAVAAFAEVQVGTGGTAITKTSGVAVGYALTSAASGTDAEISLY